MNYSKNITKVNGQDVETWKVQNDINGNPRYVTHYLTVAPTYAEAVQIIKDRLGGRVYNAKWFGGGLVFQSYSLESDLQYLLKDKE